MSIVKAYGCDICGQLKPEDITLGVARSQDLFSVLSSYPVIYRPEKAEVHFCQDCYREQVQVPAENEAPRKVSQERHQTIIAEYGAMFRKRAVDNWMKEKYFKRLA